MMKLNVLRTSSLISVVVPLRCVLAPACIALRLAYILIIDNDNDNN